MSRAFQREGVQRETEVQLADNLWAITIDPSRRSRSGSPSSSAAARRCGCSARSSAFQYFVAAAPGAQGADHDRQGLGARAARALGPPQPHLRPRDRRRAGLRPRAGDAHDAEDVRRDRARRADPAPGRRRSGDARRRRRAPATSPSRWPRRCRSTRRSSSSTRLQDAVGLGLARDRRQRALARALHAGRGRDAAQRRLERPKPEALDAVRAALAEHERASAQQAHVQRLRDEAGAPVLELPLLFEPQVGLERVPLPVRLPRVGARAADRGLDARRAARACPPRA